MNGIKVLIIDDEDTIKEYLEPYLKVRGWDVVIKVNGKSGIKSFTERRPDVVILDLGLPDMDGADVYDNLREIDKTVPIGILSGYKERRELLLKKGADDYMIKPFLPREIEDKIKVLADKKKKRLA